MQKHIAFLRGINVSGQKIIKMADLEKHFESFGFKDVQTYIQSGNVVFDSCGKTDPGAIIENGLKRILGYDVPVIIRSSDELETIIKDSPYPEDRLVPGEKIYFTFLDKSPDAEKVALLDAEKNEIDAFTVSDKDVYLLIRKGYSKTKFSNFFFEKKLECLATTRNLATTKKLLSMCD